MKMNSGMANRQSQFHSAAQAVELANSFRIITCAVITRTINQNLTESIRPSRSFGICAPALFVFSTSACINNPAVVFADFSALPSKTQVGEGSNFTPPNCGVSTLFFAPPLLAKRCLFVSVISCLHIKSGAKVRKKMKNLQPNARKKNIFADFEANLLILKVPPPSFADFESRTQILIVLFSG